MPTPTLQAFRNIGLVPDGGATYLLPRKIGWARAMELTLMGEKLAAQKALEWGMINRVVPKGALLAEGMKVAAKLATGPTKTLGMMRKLMWCTFRNSYEEQMEMEAELQSKAGATQDARAAVKAFGAKKPRPAFTGE